MHLLFNFSTITPMYVYLFLNGYDYNILIASSFIVLLFSNFPDIDISNNRKSSTKIITSTFYFFFALFAILSRKRKSIKHRGITHTFQGLIFFSTSVLIIWILLLELPINAYWLYSPIIPLSAIVAYILHLLGDAVTKEGVDFFMNGKKIRGIIRVGKTDYAFASIYAILQIFSLAYLNYLNMKAMIPFVTLIILAISSFFPIFLYYTNKDSR